MAQHTTTRLGLQITITLEIPASADQEATTALLARLQDGPHVIQTLAGELSARLPTLRVADVRATDYDTGDTCADCGAQLHGRGKDGLCANCW
ncbi:MAG TPA: hypothetical protein VNL77_16705 [Roseiflexaceae bacterium]|nr:hypothetical protein [Roseiflexaceae bacterium]